MIVIWHMLDLVEPQACFIGMQTLFHSKFYHYPYPIISIIGWDLVLWWVHMFVVWGSGILCKWQNEWIPIHHPSIVLTRGLITKPEHTPIDVLSIRTGEIWILCLSHSASFSAVNTLSSTSHVNNFITWHIATINFATRPSLIFCFHLFL